MHLKRAFFYGCAATAVSLIPASGVPAKPGSGQPVVVEGRALDPETTRIVSYADLNLTQQAARKLLIRRVGLAVRELCDRSGDVTLSDFRDEQRCFKGAWAGARPQLHSAFERARAGSIVAMTISIVGK